MATTITKTPVKKTPLKPSNRPLCPDCRIPSSKNTVGGIFKCENAECETIWDTKLIPTAWENALS